MYINKQVKNNEMKNVRKKFYTKKLCYFFKNNMFFSWKNILFLSLKLHDKGTIVRFLACYSSLFSMIIYHTE